MAVDQEWHEGRIFRHEELTSWSQEHVAFRCPVCDFECTHFDDPVAKSTDDYDAWNGRGSAVRIPMWCENGIHCWNLGIGFHKGISVLFWERDATREALLQEAEYGG